MSEKKEAPPAGAEPMMMSMKMMDTYGVKTGPGLKDTVPFKVFDKEFVMKEIIDLGFYSAFHPFRKQLEKYPLSEILVVADNDERYGENWLVYLTEASFRARMDEMEAETRAAEEAARAAEAAEAAARRAQEELERKVYEEAPLVARPFTSPTLKATEAEVALLTVQPSRPLIRMKITRKRAEFGARYTFSDKESDGAVAEFRGRRAPEYSLVRAEMDVALQDCPGSLCGHEDASTQTTFSRKLNSACQTDPVPQGSDAVGGTGDLDSRIQAFLAAVLPICEHALQQNETLNIFQDQLSLMDDDDALAAGAKGESGVRTLANFMDLSYTNNKALVALDWHPTNRSWIAASVVQDLAFETRVAASVRASVSHVVIYTFSEFSAQIVLESPLDIFCFKWNPTQPHLIAAGCASGQILLFDVGDAMHSLTRSKAKGTKSSSASDAESKSDKGDKSIHVRHKYITAIDSSHTRPVADLIWVPASHHLSARGRFEEQYDGKSYQVMSVAADGQLLVWDIRFEERAVVTSAHSSIPAQDFAAAATPGLPAPAAAAPAPAVAAEVPWNPVYKVQLRGSGQGKCGVVKFAMNPSCLSDVMYCTTEDGAFSACDWAPAGKGTGYDKAGVAPPAAPGDSEAAGSTAGGEEGAADVGSFRVLWSTQDHNRPTKALQRSPFFGDLLLSVGDWSFSLWREGTQQPIFRSPPSASLITCGEWSPTRPSVVFIGKFDGSLDVWDLVDQTNKPSLTKSVVSVPILCMKFRDASMAKTQQLLAAGDVKGNLHVLDIPSSLRKPTTSEQSLMSSYLERELSRVNYFAARLLIRNEELEQKRAAADVAERAAAAAAAAREAELAAATALLTDGETFDPEKLERDKLRKRQEAEENDYQALERAVLSELGLDPDAYVVEVPTPLVVEAIPETASSSARDSRRRSSVNVDSVRLVV